MYVYIYIYILNLLLTFYCGPDNSVGIATDYGLDGTGIESRWRRGFRTRLDRPWGPPSLLYNGYRVFPGGKAAGAWCWPPTPFQRRGWEWVELYLYSPSRPLVACYRVTFNFTYILLLILYRYWLSSFWGNYTYNTLLMAMTWCNILE
jgi:hypothetical protein